MVNAKELREFTNDVIKRKKEEQLALVETRLKSVFEEMVEAARLGKYEFTFYWNLESNKELPIDIVDSVLTEMGYYVEFVLEEFDSEAYKVRVTW